MVYLAPRPNDHHPRILLHFLYLMIQNSGPTIEELFYAQPVFTVSLMISLINPVWGHVLNQIPKEERIKKGRGDQLLSYMLVSEVLTGNLLMAAVVFITKRKLPQALNGQPLTRFEKMVAVVLLVLSIFAGLIALKLSSASF